MNAITNTIKCPEIPILKQTVVVLASAILFSGVAGITWELFCAPFNNFFGLQ